ncbi:hypothetical protein B0H13DRAFT_1964176, partial [Mycena leptocephala]
MAPLLVSCAFHCTTLPLFYTLVLHSRYQSATVFQPLRTRLHRVPCPYTRSAQFERRKCGHVPDREGVRLAPALTTLHTPHTLWAPTFAVVAANRALGQICLGDDLVSGYICFASYFDRLRFIDWSRPCRTPQTSFSSSTLPPSLDGLALFLAAAHPHVCLTGLIGLGRTSL